MATATNGPFTLKQILRFTQQYVPNRFEFRKRDVVKSIRVKEVKVVERHDLPGEPRIRTKYIIESKSWPQYYPYYTKKDAYGRKRSYQRTVAHHYDITLEIVKLSINTPEWKGRVGSGKKWDKKPNQTYIKTIYPENKARWTAVRKQSHKHRAKYLDVGDYNSRVLGLNGDFLFRCSFAWWFNKHLFGRNYFGNVPADITNPQSIVFSPKHFINIIDMLMQKGILKDD